MIRFITSRIRLTQLFAFLTSLTLIIAATGLSTNFSLLRLCIAIGLIILGALSLLNGYRLIANAEILLGVFYTPYLGIVLQRHFWVILDLLIATAIVFWTYKTTDSYQKGAAFEKYVASLFPAQSFNIKTRTHDSSKFLGRYVETDVDPDFVFQDKKTGKSFAVECKWRKGWMKHITLGQVLSWDTWKGGRYTMYGQKNRVPVFVAFGIGGTPDKPAETYFLKAEQLQYRFLKQDFIKSGRTIHQLAELLS